MFEIPVWAIGVGFIILTVGVAQVLERRLLPADRLLGRRASTRDLAEMVEQVQRRLAELDDLRNRLDEAEEMQGRPGEGGGRPDLPEQLPATDSEAERADHT